MQKNMVFLDVAHISMDLHGKQHIFSDVISLICFCFYTPNGYIVPMEIRVNFFPRISAFSRRTKMPLNGMLLIGTEFFQIIVPL